MIIVLRPGAACCPESSNGILNIIMQNAQTPAQGQDFPHNEPKTLNCAKDAHNGCSLIYKYIIRKHHGTYDDI